PRQQRRHPLRLDPLPAGRDRRRGSGRVVALAQHPCDYRAAAGYHSPENPMARRHSRRARSHPGPARFPLLSARRAAAATRPRRPAAGPPPRRARPPPPPPPPPPAAPTPPPPSPRPTRRKAPPTPTGTTQPVKGAPPVNPPTPPAPAYGPSTLWLNRRFCRPI